LDKPSIQLLLSREIPAGSGISTLQKRRVEMPAKKSPKTGKKPAAPKTGAKNTGKKK
jgi:hypothetical protein